MKSIKTLIIALSLLGMPSCHPSKEAAKPPVRIGADVKQLAGEVLNSLTDQVTIEITLGGEGETMAEEAVALVEYIGGASDKVSVTRLDLVSHYDPEGLVTTHGPVIEMKGTAPGTLRYYGYPERKEVRPFLEGILSASGLLSDIPADLETYVKTLEEEVVIRIFTTPE